MLGVGMGCCGGCYGILQLVPPSKAWALPPKVSGQSSKDMCSSLQESLSEEQISLSVGV